MGKLNMDKMQGKREEITERMSSGGDFDFYEIKSGSQVLRVLPPKGDKDEFWKEAQIHFNVGGSGVVACLKQFGKKNCPVCDEIAKLKKSKSKEDQTLAKKMRPSNRVYMNIFERGNKDKTDVVQIMQCGPTVLKCVLDIICDPEYGDITDFKEGFDITLTKTGKGIDTEYAVLPKRNPSAASATLSEEELDEALPDLETLVTEKSLEDIKSILDGESGSNDDEIDGDAGNNNEEVDDNAVTDEKEDEESEDEIEKRIRAEIEKAKKGKSGKNGKK